MERKVGHFAHSDEQILSFRIGSHLGLKGIEAAHEYARSLAKHTGINLLEALSIACKLTEDSSVTKEEFLKHLSNPKMLIIKKKGAMEAVKLPEPKEPV